MKHQPSGINFQHASPSLPVELWLNVLDRLVGVSNCIQPVAYAASHPVTKTLLALTLVSQSINPVASRYLYSYCICLNKVSKYTQFRQTLGLDLRYQQFHQHVQSAQKCMMPEDKTRHINSAYISLLYDHEEFVEGKGGEGFLIRLQQVIDLGKIIGPTLKRLVLNLESFHKTDQDMELAQPIIQENKLFTHMQNLEELIISQNVLFYFPSVVPNLKRLAVCRCSPELQSDPQEAQLGYLPPWATSMASLQTIVLQCPIELYVGFINRFFYTTHKDRNIDVIYVFAGGIYCVPVFPGPFREDDAPRFWGIDVPTSLAADEMTYEKTYELSRDFILSQGVAGTLWSQSQSSMAGPIDRQS